MPGSIVPNPKFHSSNIQVPNVKLRIPNTKFGIPNARFQIPNAKSQVTKFQVPLGAATKRDATMLNQGEYVKIFNDEDGTVRVETGPAVLFLHGHAP